MQLAAWHCNTWWYCKLRGAVLSSPCKRCSRRAAYAGDASPGCLQSRPTAQLLIWDEPDIGCG